jgi:hypothetical protein
VLEPLINNPHAGTRAVYYKALLDGKTTKEAEDLAKAAAEAAKAK